MKKYKYIYIQQIGNELFNGKPVYRIFNNGNKGQIGILSFYQPWKKYVFTSIEDCVFDISCLTDVIDFMKNEIPK